MPRSGFVELDCKVEVKARNAIGPSSGSQSCRARSGSCGRERRSTSNTLTRLWHRLEADLEGDKEEGTCTRLDGEMRALSESMRMHPSEGQVVMGARRTYVDSCISGTLQLARVLDEGMFERIYATCYLYMDRKA